MSCAQRGLFPSLGLVGLGGQGQRTWCRCLRSRCLGTHALAVLAGLGTLAAAPEPFVFFALLVIELNAVSFTALASWSTTAWGGLILRSGALVERVNALPEAGGLLLVTTTLPRMLRS